MKNAFIIHGATGNPQENWIPWLKEELEHLGYKVHTPQFPTPDGQNYDNWISVIETYLKDFNEDTLLIGHSIGATFCLAILEKLDIRIAKTILVSGFVGKLNISFDEINETIAERMYDWQKIKNNSHRFAIYHGTDDPYVPDDKAVELATKLSTKVVMVFMGGHLNLDAGFNTFPTLIREITKPEILYHGSETHDIKVLEPQIPRDEENKDEPNAVYASDDYTIAVILAYKGTSDKKTFMCVNGRGKERVINYIGTLSKKDFVTYDAPMSIYHLDSREFYHNDGADMSEYISDNSQKPLKEEKTQSVLSEATRRGVNFYSVSEKVFNEIHSDMSRNQEVIIREDLQPLNFNF